ncbi:NADH:flavin oxidoreductase/NADH oxidase [Sistotremastrum niveocremeum HHB9708]|uniref:NADH:flavin oxidoreductase/NADH oxidase n=1 Tax=Sistotremastrum niveocremeum HHB9708 TaxID=1314777 RepID=A0A164WNL5_9AGAM|nr:NADH:flavin oxidoreductase/NADH oxidase [Sistotremastrum niveocremeum HHB9708]
MALFTPLRVGNITLQHRVALAPLTRFRATQKEHVPTDIVPTYYAQRAAAPGTLLITEATFIASQAGGYDYVPGIWNEDQIKGWSKVTAAVHEKKSFIFVQLWALGRAADPKILAENNHPYVSASATQLGDKEPTRELTKEEIKEYVELYAQAAENAVMAGFDGVEIHGANGYLIDQFLQTNSNHRTDEYGGSITNRTRFALEVVRAVSSRIGAAKTSIRLSPWSKFQGMKMPDPIPTFSSLISSLATDFPDLAYIHLTEPRVDGGNDKAPGDVNEQETNDVFRKIWAPRPFLNAGGHTRESALKDAEKYPSDVIVFGRHFISNPDLVDRLRVDAPLTPYDRATFYKPGSPDGYIDYPTYTEVKARA